MEYTAGSRPFSLRKSRKAAGSGRETSCCSSLRSETEPADESSSSIFLGSILPTRNCRRRRMVDRGGCLLFCPRGRREGPAPNGSATPPRVRGEVEPAEFEPKEPNWARLQDYYLITHLKTVSLGILCS
jgi:hypothetical protein